MKTAVAFGTFDGIHAGHRAVLKHILPYNSIAVTFSSPPHSESSLLMSATDKLFALKEIGVKKVVSLDFSRVKNLSPKEFLDVIKNKYSPDIMCCGFNFRFGKNASGDTETIKEYCKQNNIECFVASPVTENGMAVSSTSIRNYIKQGDVEKANGMMFKSFSFTSPVCHGDARGRTLGFPTANQIYPENLVKPRFGVYETLVNIDGKDYRAISNIGIRPTFSTETVGAETFIIGFSGNVYGSKIKLTLVRFLRDEKKFSDIDELKKQIKDDLSEVGL